MESVEKSASGRDQNSIKHNENNDQPNSPYLASQGQALRAYETKPEKPKRKLPLVKILVAGIVILITQLAFGLIAYLMMAQNKAQVINSYEECVAAGHPIMESYPEKCLANGQTFTRALTPNEKEEIKPSSNNVTITESQNIADWSTYTFYKAGFSIDFPANWYYIPDNGTGFSNQDVSAPLEMEQGGVWVSIQFYEGDESIKDLFDAPIGEFSNDQMSVKKLSEWNLNDNKIVKYSKVNQPHGDYEVTYLTPLDKKYIIISFITASVNTGSANMSLYDQILSTFKFTDASEASSVDTSNWKTYENAEYGFSFKYPGALILEDKSAPEIAQVVLVAQGFRETIISASRNDLSNYYLDSSPVGKTSIGGISGNKYFLPEGYCDGPTCSSSILAVSIIKNGIKYVFSTFVGKDDNDFTELEYQILSTFNFTK